MISNVRKTCILHTTYERITDKRYQLKIYHLISLLHDEARLVNIQVKLVSEGRIRQDHRRRYVNLQGRIFRYWGEFAARERDATCLLRACSRVNGPQM